MRGADSPLPPWSTEGVSQRVRVYLPATLTTVAALHRDRRLPPGPAFAVTPALRAELGEDDLEELEYQAFRLAADASLALLRQDPTAPRRRVVISADARVNWWTGGGKGGRSSPSRCPCPRWPPSTSTISRRQPEVAAALTSDGEVDEELSWYDVSELPQLVG